MCLLNYKYISERYWLKLSIEHKSVVADIIYNSLLVLLETIDFNELEIEFMKNKED